MESPPGCGICLSDGGGRSVRGEIDSCDHYFCFVCIMEWAKVESRCPMCKRRFNSIRRPPKIGVFAVDRVVNVPRRDQVFHLFGNATTTRSDPYADTRCSICNSMADESFLLLCDLCDSAVHTYCVGLGHTVPEGDWFCHDCAIIRAEHEKVETDIETNHQINSGNSVVEVEPEGEVSILDIVRDPDDHLCTRLISLFDHMPYPVSALHGTLVADEETRSSATTSRSLVDEATESSARTLHQCRNVHSRIRTLRENWNALRIGSLKFSSSSGESSAESSKKQNGSLASTALSSNRQSTAENGNSGVTGEKKDPYNIDKAWKMMNMAKPVKQNVGRGSSLHQASKVLSGKRVAAEQPSKIRPSIFSSDKQQGAAWKLTSCVRKKQSRPSFQDHDIDKCRSQILEKQKQKKVLMVAHCKELPGSSSKFCEHPLFRVNQIESDASGTGSSAKAASRVSSSGTNAQSESLLPREKQIRSGYPSVMGAQEQKMCFTVEHGKELLSPSSQFDGFPLRRENQIQRYSSGVGSSEKAAHRMSSITSSIEINVQRQSCRMVNSARTAPGVPDPSSIKQDFVAPSASKLDDVKAKKARLEKDSAGETDDAKSEIQSLVKLNLKLLSKGNTLGVNTFKEIARLSTHTILASCGLEPPKPGIRSFQSSICKHGSEMQDLRRSTLMPNACRECFYAFVRDVVKSVMTEKAGHDR